MKAQVSGSGTALVKMAAFVRLGPARPAKPWVLP
jgi:hypothetical protein